MPAIKDIPEYGSQDHMDQLSQKIQEYILGQLNQPTPQAPTPPTPQPLGWAQAAAGAMNPQFIPYFQQQANAPGQARYKQAQDAFEAAIQGKQRALGLGTQMADVQTRVQGQQDVADANNQIKMLLGMLKNSVDQQNANTRANPPEKPPDETNWQIFTDRNGDVWQVDPKSGAKRKLDLQGKLPAAETNTQSGLNAVQDTLDEMRALYETAVQKHGPGERNIQEGLQSIPIVRNVAGAFDPLAQQHEALRNKLVLQLNKPVSGQNRLLQAEITQLLKYVPAYGTDPKVAIPQFDSMQKMIDQFKQKYAAQPSQGVSTGNPTFDHARAIAEWIKGGKVGPRP